MADSVNRIYIIKWINKYSNEVGYVKYIKEDKGHFINTYDITHANRYRSYDEAEQAVSLLNRIGEGKMNYFSIEGFCR